MPTYPPVAPSTQVQQLCTHCGDPCDGSIVDTQQKTFCCHGCRTVYELLNDKQLCGYYQVAGGAAGVSQKSKRATSREQFAALDTPLGQQQYVRFTEGNRTLAVFSLPQIHCSSCLWLLERLHQVHDGIMHSAVDFLEKTVSIWFDNARLSLSEVAHLLSAVGYEPYLSLQNTATGADAPHAPATRLRTILRIGVAGFCFGNIMLLSFPAYLSGEITEVGSLAGLFAWLNLILALPVVIFSAYPFYESAWKSLRHRVLNMDAPIVLAVLVTFVRSCYEVVAHGQEGYFDSMSGIVFFMLLGRYFQDRTYARISFDRDYRSYFPLSVLRKEADGAEKSTPLSELAPDDHIFVRNGELVPADALIVRGSGAIDYSFVTGESVPVAKHIGELVYAGGRQIGEMLELRLLKPVSQSHLTRLWNRDASGNGRMETPAEIADRQHWVQQLSRWFSYIVFAIAALSGLYWWVTDAAVALDAITATLIIACPCALLLSATFTNGNAMRLLGSAGVYLKNALTLDTMTRVDTVVLDKTGTITDANNWHVEYQGDPMDELHRHAVYSLAAQSLHPLSRAISRYWANDQPLLPTNYLREYPGQGIEGRVGGMSIKLGTEQFVTGRSSPTRWHSTTVVVSIGNKLRGRFLLRNQYVQGLEEMVRQLRTGGCRIHVLSGDNDAERDYLQALFEVPDQQLQFHCSPEDKMQYVSRLQQQGHCVMMIGDGLNDAGALRQSDVGVAVSTDSNYFTPASDVVMSASRITQLPSLLRFAAASQRIIRGAFIISLVYNVVGLWFAVRGELAPVIAAILMPASTISIVLYTTSASTWAAKKVLRFKDSKPTG